MPSEEKALTINPQTVAANPGRLEIQYPVFLRCFPQRLALPGLCLLAAVGLVLSGHGNSIRWALITLALTAFRLLRIKEHFRHGCVNPAVVVSHQPDRIAVYTDLSTDGSPWPAIKILSHPLDRMTGGRPAVGTRLATISLYTGNAQQPRWSNFSPVAVNCATADPAEIERVQASLSPAEWAALEAGLRQVPTPERPGLYPID